MSEGVGERALGLVRDEARRRVRETGRKLAFPWREGRSGAEAEIGRWLGLGAAVGAAVAGLAAALYVARRGRREP